MRAVVLRCLSFLGVMSSPHSVIFWYFLHISLLCFIDLSTNKLTDCLTAPSSHVTVQFLATRLANDGLQTLHSA